MSLERADGFQALTALAPEDFQRLITVVIDQDARIAVAGRQGQGEIARALISHYDVPYRGLSVLEGYLRREWPGLLEASRGGTSPVQDEPKPKWDVAKPAPRPIPSDRGPVRDDPPPPDSIARIKLILERDFQSFSIDDQRALMDAINRLAGTSGGLRIVKVAAGSVKLTIEGPAEDILRVWEAFNRGQFASLGVRSASLDPEPATAETTQEIDHIVLLVHGIRDQGDWQQTAQEAISQVPGMAAIRVGFGYYDAVSFVSPLGNAKKPYDTLHQTYNDIRSRHPDVKVSVIAHSFGSYLLGELIKKNPSVRLHRILLCGSVMRRDYRWVDYTDRFGVDVPNRQKAILNECGTTDMWPVVAASASNRYGDVGRRGFDNNVYEETVWYNGGHGCFFSRQHMREKWIPFLRSGTIPQGEAVQPPSSWYERFAATFFVGWLWFLGVTLLLLVRIFWWVVLLMAAAGGYYYLFGRQPPGPPADPAEPVAKVSTHIRVTVNNADPSQIGPSTLMARDPALIHWKGEYWQQGPNPEEAIKIPSWGKYEFICSVNRADGTFVPKKPGSVSLSDDAVPMIPNVQYKKTIELGKEHEWIDFTNADILFPKPSGG